jgi:hypothetical protein
MHKPNSGYRRIGNEASLSQVTPALLAWPSECPYTAGKGCFRGNRLGEAVSLFGGIVIAPCRYLKKR